MTNVAGIVWTAFNIFGINHEKENNDLDDKN